MINFIMDLFACVFYILLSKIILQNKIQKQVLKNSKICLTK